MDTSALIAFADRADSYHGMFHRLFSAPPSLVTTALVIAEGHAWFLRGHDPARALEFLAMIESMSPLAVLPVGAGELSAGADVLRRLADQRLTLTDAVGLHVMRIQQVAVCWSTDFHLGLTGVPLVIDGAKG